MAFERLHQEMAPFVPPIFSIQGRKPDLSKIPSPPDGLTAFETERFRRAPFTLAEFGFGNQMMAVVDKIAPHSVTDVMLSTTGRNAPALYRNLHPSVGRAMLHGIETFARYATDPEIIKKFGLGGGFFRVSINCDELTGDRGSVQTDKNFHPHCICFPPPNANWAGMDVTDSNDRENNRLKTVDPFTIVGSYAIQDLLFDRKSPFYRSEITDVFEPVDFDPQLFRQNGMPVAYHLKLKNSWESLVDPKMQTALKILNDQLDEAYGYIAGIFVPKEELASHPTPWQRPNVLPQEVIYANIHQAGLLRDRTKDALALAAGDLRTVPHDVMGWLEKRHKHLKVGMAERIIGTQGPSYTWTFYSPGTVEETRENEKWKKDAFLVIHPVFTRPLGAGGVSFGPKGETLKVERGAKSVMMDEPEKAKRADFQTGFVNYLRQTNLGLSPRREYRYERKFAPEEKPPWNRFEVIRKGMAAALNHFNGSPDSSRPGFNFDYLSPSAAEEIGLDTGNSDGRVQFALGKTAVKDKSVIFRAEFRPDGGIFKLHDFVILDETTAHKLNGPDELIGLFGIDPNELANIENCIRNEMEYDRRYAQSGREFRNILNLNDPSHPETIPITIHESAMALRSQCGSEWKSRMIGLFESFNTGGRPENVFVPYPFLSDVPMEYFPGPGNMFRIPFYKFTNTQPAYFDRLKSHEGSTLTVPDGFAFALHPYTALKLGLTPDDFPDASLGQLTVSPTASIRSLQVINSDGSNRIGADGTTVKVALKARLSNDVKMLDREDLTEMMEISRLFTDAPVPPPETFLPQIVHEVVGVEAKGRFLGCALRDLPKGLGSNEIPVSGFSLIAELPREFGGMPLVVQAVEKHLENSDFDNQEQAILDWFRQTIVIPPVEAMNYCTSLGVLPLMHGQDVAWAYDVETGELKPKVIVKDLQDKLSELPEKRAGQLVRMFDNRFGDQLIQPIIEILATTYNIDPENFVRIIRDEFRKRMERKNEYLIKGDVLTIIVDMFLRAFEGKGKSRTAPNQNLYAKPPKFRSEDISDYLS